MGRRNEQVIFQIQINKHVKTCATLLIFNKIKIKTKKIKN